MSSREANRNSYKLFAFVKIMGKLGGVSIHFYIKMSGPFSFTCFIRFLDNFILLFNTYTYL